MNKFLPISIVLCMAVLTGCRDKTIEKITYTANVPIYMSFEDAQATIISQSPQTLENPGKIYYYQNYIFINERFKGIHVINNTNPFFPEKVAFINIPANIDMAVKGNVLYADCYTDLVSIDISDIQNVRVLDRDPAVFEAILPSTNNDYPMVLVDPNQGIVIGWEEKEITETRDVDSEPRYYVDNCMDCEVMMDDGGSSDFSVASSGNGAEATAGIGGSMARFTLLGNYLYAVHGSKLRAFDLAELTDPIQTSTIELSREVETLFPAKKDKLFIGTTTGMLVYDVSNPGTPQYLSQFEHMRNCDPVAVEGDYAYVTLRTGNECGGSQNQLDVINITDIAQPYWEASYQFVNPHGLGVRDGILFICDGDAGLKVYNTSDVMNIDKHQLAHFQDLQSTDVIPLKDVLLMIGSDGFYQYNYADVEDIQLMSSITKGE